MRLIISQEPVLIVSHDREFLDGLVNVVYEFRNKKIKQHLGGIYEFLQKKKMESLKELEVNTRVKSTSENGNNKEISAKGPDFEERKKINKNISRLEKKIEQTEEEIAELEGEIAEIAKMLVIFKCFKR